jgi:mannose/cellobiose epimerase-like protein (N-acyl-D-glucosamine 2-epimerase family)
MIEKHLDRQWIERSLVRDALAHWVAVAPTESGFFRNALDRRWRPAEEQHATLVSQGRLLYVFAVGYEVTGQRAYLDALRKGAAFLAGRFRDGEHGGWFFGCGPDGRVLEDHKDSYGHAFAMFGLSHGARALGDRALEAAALETWEVVRTRLRDDAGGLKRRTSRDFRVASGTNSQNPIMHMFEAAQALHEATGSRAAFEAVAGLAEFLFDRLFDEAGGYVAELYDERWRPLDPDRGGYVNVGHQFELAFLVCRAVERGLSAAYLAKAHRLVDWGLKSGYDRGIGGIFSGCRYDGSVTHATKGWWEQAELLRALMHVAELHGRDDLWEPFEESLALVREHFMDAEYGGWFASYDPAAPPEDRPTDKGSAWKVDYHVTGLYAEALRLLDRPENEQGCGQRTA